VYAPRISERQKAKTGRIAENLVFMRVCGRFDLDLLVRRLKQ
jgi:hypothetical protein